MKDVNQNKLKQAKILPFLEKYKGFSPNLFIFEEIDSTNTYLLNNYSGDGICICTAESQTKGRGRGSNRWESPKYENIYLSLSFITSLKLKDFSSFSLVVGISLAEVLNSYGFESKLKWPNDIFLNGKKVGGILVETKEVNSRLLVVVGIGLNIKMKLNDDIDREWTSLTIEKPKLNIDRNNLIIEIVNNLQSFIPKFEAEGFNYFVDSFNKLNFLYGKQIFSENISDEPGVAGDVNEDGTLNINFISKQMKIGSGEVSVKFKK